MLIKIEDQDKINNRWEKNLKKINLNKTGLINEEELKKAFKMSEIDIPADKIDENIDEFDFYGNKKINYT